MAAFEPLAFVAGRSARASAGEGFSPLRTGLAEAPEPELSGEGAVPHAVPPDLETLLADAEARGRQARQAEVQPQLRAARQSQERLARLIAELDEQREEWATEARDTLSAFILASVDRIVGDAEPVRHALLRSRLAEITEHLVRSRELVLRVAPADEALARQIIGDRPGWRFTPSATLRGGVVAEADGGRIDGSLQAALEGLSAVLEAWKDAAPVGGAP